ncbi:hypothetical protein BM536_007820 [Streptomyces phaeoluteigriseus]|uniref:Uncharacterized protein n=1 Tax=Streptomyces phaeoluteigriseus TaxID=114686 RepID=A0A1V6MUS7_9ACTN|nr:hypothetical protein BM536_007820 [Streptomyces phaeoluteigriseus]
MIQTTGPTPHHPAGAARAAPAPSPQHPRTCGLQRAVGVLWIEPPAGSGLDPHATVLAVELDGELELYRGSGCS